MALSTLYLLNFNNYYNRQVKGAKYTLEDYMEYVVYGPFTRINFNPADGIATQHVVNTTDSNYNYLLVVDELGEIASRWFVIQAARTLSGQYQLSLHRDLLVDYFEQATTAKCYIERAMLSVGNPFIFNSENITFNQIKKREILLKDKSQTPWIVGYVANNYYETPNITVDGTDGNGYVYAETDQERQPTYSASWRELRAIGRITTGATINNQTIKFTCANPNGVNSWVFQQGAGGEGAYDIAGTNYNTNWYCSGGTSALQAFRDAFFTADEFFVGLSKIKDYVPGYKTNISTYKQYAGQALRNTDYIEGQEATNGPKYFYFNMVQLAQNTESFKPPVGSEVYNQMRQYIYDIYTSEDLENISSQFYFNEDTGKTGTFEVSFPCEVYSCSASATPTTLNLRADLYGSTDSDKLPKQQLYDAPYTMFATPYDDCIFDMRGNQTINHQGIAARNIASQISKILGGSGSTSYIYDLQLLPYCPLPQLLDDTEPGHIKLSNWNYASDNISLIKYGVDYGEDAGVILWLPQSSFSFTIDLEEPINMPTDPIEAKIDIETKMCRLVSPNYAGAFEFTPMKNGGVSGFEVNCTYKPYQPYIQVNPKFNTGFLYGGDYDDNRGLICGGDFSLPQVSDAWINYQAQNKSYRESFNRQVENMETIHRIEMRQMRTTQWASGASGVIQGATSGALAGSMVPVVGTAIGAATGAAAAAVANVVGASADLKAAEELHNEAKSFAQAQFNYSLQNIQALPTTMSRVSAFDINNKKFVFLEFYEATPDEEQALRDKIKYNSMTVMAIGTVEKYMQEEPTYISGQLIRIENLDEDYHLATAIAGELHKGIFI